MNSVYRQYIAPGGLTVDEAKLRLESLLIDLRAANAVAKQVLGEWYGIWDIGVGVGV
jgi:hypothetical protein